MKMVRGSLRLRAGAHKEQGQSLLETAVSVPLLLCVAFNIINWAYFWFMVLALSSAPRHAVQYASQGGAAIANSSGIPAVADVCSLVADNFGNNVLHSSSMTCGSGNVQIRVCISSLGVNTTTGVVSCQSYGPSLMTFPAPAADPEEPEFALQRVDVAYQVTPIIPGTVFNIAVPTNLKFHRQVSMRSLY